MRKNEEGLINAVSNIVNLSMGRSPFGILCTNQTVSSTEFGFGSRTLSFTGTDGFCLELRDKTMGFIAGFRVQGGGGVHSGV